VLRSLLPLALLPLLTTCALHPLPSTLSLRLKLPAGRSPELAAMSCFAVVMRTSGNDSVSDAVTGNFPHACLGLDGDVSSLVTLATARSGVAVTVTTGTYTGEVLAFKSPAGSCEGKSLTELFATVPEVYSVASIPSTSIQNATTIEVATTYQSASASDKILECPRSLVCSPAGSVDCSATFHVTADNYYSVFLADRLGGNPRRILTAPDNDWTSPEGMSGVAYTADDYFYFVAWNAGFQRGALFRLMVGTTVYESSVDKLIATVGPVHSADSTPLSNIAFTALLATNPPWYSPQYHALNNGTSGWPTIVPGMDQAKWFWLDEPNVAGQIENQDPNATYYTGVDSDPYYVVFRSKCRLIEIANRENGCL